VSDCCLTPTHHIFHLFHGETSSLLKEMIVKSALHYTNTLSWRLQVLTH